MVTLGRAPARNCFARIAATSMNRNRPGPAPVTLTGPRPGGSRTSLPRQRRLRVPSATGPPWSTSSQASQSSTRSLVHVRFVVLWHATGFRRLVGPSMRSCIAPANAKRFDTEVVFAEDAGARRARRRARSKTSAHVARVSHSEECRDPAGRLRPRLTTPGSRQRNVQRAPRAGMSSAGFTLHSTAEGACDVHSELCSAMRKKGTDSDE